jgi:hypothetical protein
MFTFNQTTDTYSLATDVELTLTENLDLTGSATISGDLTVDTNTLFVDSTNNEVGIGTTSPDARLHIQATAATSGQDLIKLANGADACELVIDTSANEINFKTGTGDDIVFLPEGTEALRIGSDGKVGIGIVPSGARLEVSNGDSGVTPFGDVFFEDDAGFALALATPNTDSAVINFADPESNNVGQIGYDHSNNSMTFDTAGSEAMRIDSSQQLLVGKTTSSGSVVGAMLGPGYLTATRSASTPITVNRLTNDGTLIRFEQANILEGSISVSGATVTYGGFTGTHWSRLSDNSKPTILKGTILESLDEMMDWYQVQFDIIDEEGNTITHKESYALGDGENVGDVITYTYEGTDYQATIIQEGDVKHTKSKISDTVDAKNVYGVFVDWDNDDDTVNDMYVAQTGSYVIRINGSETVSKGDLIQSNGDGTGKVQSDDIIRASTVAKVISSTIIETYDDGSYIVPCTLHC